MTADLTRVVEEVLREHGLGDAATKWGLNHPFWDSAGIFHFDSREEAEESIRKVYGENSGHVAVPPLAATVVAAVGEAWGCGDE